MRAIDTYDGENRTAGDFGGVPRIVVPPVVTPPPTVPTINLQTGGPNPPVQVVTSPKPPLQTGGPQPPVQVQTYNLHTGGPNPPVQVQPKPNLQTGGPNPPVYIGNQNPNGNTGVVPPPATNPYGPAQTVDDMMSYLLNNSQYIRNAQRRGLETAQQRGLLNSNMAAQASTRAAIESAAPLVSEGMSLLNNRETRAQTALESERDRQFRRLLQSDQATQQDWLNSNQFNREFNANLSMIPIASSTDFMKYLFQLGAENPEVYTPNIMAGMQNFFTQSMLAMLDRFMPD